jgi:hypothetical protein
VLTISSARHQTRGQLRPCFGQAASTFDVVVFGAPDQPGSRPQRHLLVPGRPAGGTQADMARAFRVDATTIGRLQQGSGRPFGLQAWPPDKTACGISGISGNSRSIIDFWKAQ